MEATRKPDGTLAERGVELTCAGVVLVLFVIFLFRLYSDWKDKRQKRLVKNRPYEFPILMMIPGIHRIQHDRLTFICGAESFDGDRPSYNTRYCHSEDFQFLENLLKRLTGTFVRVPETVISVSIPRKYFLCAEDSHTCFYPTSGPSFRAHCNYKMLSPRVQGTYYVKRGKSFLAGLTIYPRLLIDVANQGIPLEREGKIIMNAWRKKDNYVPRQFSMCEKMLESRWCYQHQRRLVIIRNRYGLDWKYWFNETDGYFELVRCNACCAGGPHVIRNHQTALLLMRTPLVEFQLPSTEITPPPYRQIGGPPPSYESIQIDEASFFFLYRERFFILSLREFVMCAPLVMRRGR